MSISVSSTAVSTTQASESRRARVLKSIVTWSWTKRLLYWIVMSAGTASELVFLLAAIWVSVNANVHGFVLTFLSEKQTIYLTYLATTSFVALPECIVGLAIVTTIGHIKMWKTGGKSSIVWSILFGTPAFIFLALTLITIGCSVANVTFTMPTFFVVVRALAAFIFAFTAFIYHFLGQPQEHERLQEKESMIANMKQENAVMIANLHKEISEIRAEWQREKTRMISDWQHETAYLKAEIEKQNEVLAESKKQNTMLLSAVNKSSETALQGYTEECLNWIKSGAKSVLLEDIIRYSGHSKRKIQGALNTGMLQKSPRNDNLILMSSVVKWLKQTPAKTDTEPDLYVVNG